MARIKISLNKRKTQTQNLSIRLRVTFDNQRIDLFTGYTVDLKQWDEAKEQAKHGITNAQGYTYSEINSGLADRKVFISDYFTRCTLEKKSPSKADLETTYRRNFDRSNDLQSKEKTLFDCFDEFLKVEGADKSWAQATIIKFKTLKNHLSDFNPNLSFTDLSEQGLRKFINYLQDILNNASTEKNHKFLKWFLSWATKRGYNQTRDFETFKVNYKTANNAPVFLTWEELMRLYSFKIPKTKQYLTRVRDLFCFCAFTSLRYSDLMNLKWSDIKKDHIEITTIKDRDALKIDLNTYSRAILKKYKNTLPEKGNKVFLHITNQKYNDYLKELGKLCKIDEPVSRIDYKKNERIETTQPKYELLTTHVARKTFISYAISQGVSPEIIMKWTGHNDYKAMRPYIAIADKTKKEAMHKIFDKSS